MANTIYYIPVCQYCQARGGIKRASSSTGGEPFAEPTVMYY